MVIKDILTIKYIKGNNKKSYKHITQIIIQINQIYH